MASKRQIDANRRNAQRSTGPRTAAGKTRSSANALRHGLTAARAMVLPDESADAFERFRNGVAADLDPQGMLQAALAERIATLLWRLDRAARLEAELFLHGQLVARRDRLHASAQREAFEHLLRAGREAAGEEVDEDAESILDEATRMINEQIRAEAPSAKILVEYEASARIHERLARHEGALQRALNRTLDEYRRLRAAAGTAPEADADAEPGPDDAPPCDADAGPPCEAADPAAETDDDADDKADDETDDEAGAAPRTDYCKTKPIRRKPLIKLPVQAVQPIRGAVRPPPPALSPRGPRAPHDATGPRHA